MLIARTDALTVEGLGAAIERAQVYAASGADVIFIEAPVTIEEIEAIARHVPQPKLIKMLQGGKTRSSRWHAWRRSATRSSSFRPTYSARRLARDAKYGS